MVVYDPSAETLALSTDFWGIIGDFNGWSGDVAMLNGGDGKFYAACQTMKDGWKIRKSAARDANRGGVYVSGETITAVPNGDNLIVDDLDSYSVIYDAAAETITIE